ncbi:MAG: sugar phosphate isomerase/epimerase [Terrimicrobiaceae bacterium]|nr:sugar phosphate isomerase/epimerase [Terrimicrobiaceae bacterium]
MTILTAPTTSHTPLATNVWAVSNIAWSAEEDEAAYDLLVQLSISHVEVAPGRIWPAPSAPESGTPPPGLVARGLGIIGFQAILFGKPDLLLFDPQSRPNLAAELRALAGTCARSGGRYLVFGAPKNRFVPASLSAEEAFDTSVEFFGELGRHCESLGVLVGIEANPAAYGCNFCTQSADVARLVNAVKSPAVRWHLDTGALAMNEESVPDMILQNAGIIGSVHISEPQLGDFSTPWSGHNVVAGALREAGYSGSISLEMKRPSDGLSGVRRALDFVLATYQP